MARLNSLPAIAALVTRLLWVVDFFAIAAVQAHAATGGSISGTVADPSGG